MENGPLQHPTIQHPEIMISHYTILTIPMQPMYGQSCQTMAPDGGLPVAHVLPLRSPLSEGIV